jgi:hypothetical protein
VADTPVDYEKQFPDRSNLSCDSNLTIRRIDATFRSSAHEWIGDVSTSGAKMHAEFRRAEETARQILSFALRAAL